MVDNQHQKIKGYRDLSEEEIAQMNLVKESAEKLGELLDQISQAYSVDQRWLSIGKTHLQQGFMAVVRSIAKPDSF